MSNIDKPALREAAEMATKGEWVVFAKPTPTYFDAIHSLAALLNGTVGDQKTLYMIDANGLCPALTGTGPNSANNAEFIAAANPATMLALLDELEAKDSTIATQQQEIRTLLNALEQATEKRNSDIPGQKRLIGWRASDYTDETSDPELAKNWAAAIGVLPIFEGDVNTKLSAAGIGKGE